MKGCAFSKGDSFCYHKKKILFPSSFWGIFDFFVFFNILKSLKKNKIMPHYKGGASVISILVPSTRNILILIARRHVQEKDIWGKFLHGSRCQVIEARSDTRLLYKACFKGSVESNMEPTLGQRCRDENVINKTQWNPLQCNLMSPLKVRSVVFSHLESLKKHKIRLHWGTFFEGSLVSSKKG